MEEQSEEMDQEQDNFEVLTESDSDPNELDYDADWDESGYSYLPELQPAHNLIGDNWNSFARHILNNCDPNSEFHKKYKFTSHQPLGTGKSSTCMKCYNSSDDNYYAVKIYKRMGQNENEIDFLQKAAHVSGVVQMVELLTDSKCTYLVMELIDGVNLLECFSTTISYAGLFCEAIDKILEILENVHEIKYTHRRICFKNIYFLKQSREFRFIGFGNTKPITGAQDKQIDYWSMGVCLYTLLCGHSPFNSSIIDVAAKLIENNKFDENSKQWSALHRDVKGYILQLLRSSTSTYSSGALKNVKDISFVVHCSKELLDENKNVVEIRARKLETKTVIETQSKL
ncbi:ribosomal protein S6 kinase alpha-5-like [Bradysia coprophila]|uniref:ribosomal protein S6 kinase alpha-5-like n=1 Tax=Bradysia coprophila TaxID=38358 RepID=UPI00187D859D|nr:ribosomal protein S6 kinase alpha-5-like [Bradysia coprophila]